MSTFLRDLLLIAQNPYVALIFLTALVFDFINGFHDAANSVATVVGTRVLRPFQAVCWAAWWNFAAAWFFGVHIANAVAKWVHADYVTVEVIFTGLIGAIVRRVHRTRCWGDSAARRLSTRGNGMTSSTPRRWCRRWSSSSLRP